MDSIWATLFAGGTLPFTGASTKGSLWPRVPKPLYNKPLSASLSSAQSHAVTNYCMFNVSTLHFFFLYWNPLVSYFNHFLTFFKRYILYFKNTISSDVLHNSVGSWTVAVAAVEKLQSSLCLIHGRATAQSYRLVIQCFMPAS